MIHRTPARHFAVGLKAYRRRRYEVATLHAEKGVNLSTKGELERCDKLLLPKLYCLEGCALAWGGHSNEARKCITEAKHSVTGVANADSFNRVLLNQAIIHLWQGEYDLAEAITSAVIGDPDGHDPFGQASAWLLLAQTLLVTNEWRQAGESLEAVYQLRAHLDTPRRIIHLLLHESYCAQTGATARSQHLATELEACPDWLRECARAWSQQNRPERAIDSRYLLFPQLSPA